MDRLGVLGAGFMGAGIAYVSAKAGLEVVLIDRDLQSAEKGKAHSDSLISKDVSRGRATQAEKDALQRAIQSAHQKDLEEMEKDQEVDESMLVEGEEESQESDF